MSDEVDTTPTDQPDPKAIVGGAFSAAAETYDQVVGFFAPFGRALVTAADPDRGAKVLDIACGRGACLYPALDAVGRDGSVLGIDLAAGMVEQLNAELTAKGIRNAEARVGDAEDLDLPDGWFDVVTGGFMIFFPPDPPRVLRELHRVLAPGGTLALSIFDGPSGFPWMGDIADELFGPSPRMPSHEFDKAAVLDDALVAAGFTRPIGIEVIERFRFANAGQVEAWMRSHGGRLLLDRCDDQQLARCRELIAQNLEAHHRTADGADYELVQRARMTVAQVA
jgi:ubiquinone/menaquinone biosynthesis C-methylase UbiE